jgi:erythromycin esterase
MVRRSQPVATEESLSGMVNVGQLVREQHQGEGVILVGFGSHRGSVIAGKAWNAPMERMPVPKAREGSWEDIMHRAGAVDKLLLLPDVRDNEALLESRGHRAIGVVYHPGRERYGNYVPTVLPRRYDAFLYIDETEALHPIRRRGTAEQPPQMYPWGF